MLSIRCVLNDRLSVYLLAIAFFIDGEFEDEVKKVSFCSRFSK